MSPSFDLQMNTTDKPTRKEVSILSKLPAEEVADKLSEYRRAQSEREEKRKQAQDEKRRRAEEAKEAGKQFTSISELSASMAEPKRRNDVSNVIGIIKDMAQEFLSTCETFFDEFPELKGPKKPTLLDALADLKHPVRCAALYTALFPVSEPS